ncbi:phosphodiester glycosidase family protein [Paenibacillus sp. J2TS4]|uniref:phosphodiester glycosidase family protein n=1 Tax=Paenibacillus sp. J2TS4 TaxID=2807194 RepID=UPI001B19AFA0|nr:phosphodiester glycosidase family protein [Paenibacillus sp. J2TS4]GIP31960.1 hypothetical protein J2TS4_11700 [Paenibacillus sp. J2TS4]
MLFMKRRTRTLSGLLVLGSLLLLLAFNGGTEVAANNILSRAEFQVVPGVQHETGTVQMSMNFHMIAPSEKSKDKEKETVLESDKETRIVNVFHRLKARAGHPHLKLELVPATEHVTGKDTVTNIAAKHDREGHRVVAAVNADFFDVPTGVPLGLHIMDGEILTTPTGMSSTYLAVMTDGTYRMGGSVQVESWLRTESGGSLELDGFNKIRKDKMTDHALILTDRFGPSTLSEGSGGVEVILTPDAPSEKWQPGKEMSGTVEAILTGFNHPIPQGKYVLSASGAKADWIRQNLQTGEAVSVKIEIDSGLDEAEYVLAGFNHRFANVLVHEGKVAESVLNIEDKNYFEHHPRTVLALKDNELYAFVFDGRQPGFSDGISTREQAALLQAMGMDEAINVDGGGSSTYAVRMPGDTGLTVLNRPSDGKERPVGNALLLVSTKP